MVASMLARSTAVPLPRRNREDARRRAAPDRQRSNDLLRFVAIILSDRGQTSAGLVDVLECLKTDLAVELGERISEHDIGNALSSHPSFKALGDGRFQVDH